MISSTQNYFVYVEGGKWTSSDHAILTNNVLDNNEITKDTSFNNVFSKYQLFYISCCIATQNGRRKSTTDNSYEHRINTITTTHCTLSVLQDKSPSTNLRSLEFVRA